jgi:hypothetical protein
MALITLLDMPQNAPYILIVEGFKTESFQLFGAFRRLR